MMSKEPTSEANLYMLLGEINANVKSGNTKLDEVIRRVDGHEQRLQKQEQESAKRSIKDEALEAVEAKVAEHSDELLRIRTTAATTTNMVKIAWTVLGSAILAIGAKLFDLL